MNLANERNAGFSVQRPPTLDAVIARLNRLSFNPSFAVQREMALSRVLKPYLEGAAGKIIAPLAQEIELANLLLICDFYPEDGQLTLIEQLRDVITEHVPNEERVWLDPLKHSYLDLLELTSRTGQGENLALRSIGDGTALSVPGGESVKNFVIGQVLLTRVIRDPDGPDSGRGFIAGCGIILSPDEGRALYEATREWERSMELSSGSFNLGEWQEFAKRFGHILLWNFAEMRVAELVDAVSHVRYRTPNGRPYLFVLALYDHHEYQHFSDGLSEMKEFEVEAGSVPPGSSGTPGPSNQVRRWKLREAETGDSVARLTLTSTQLIVECDSPDRLNAVKHRLAAAFGFSLHFRGEALTPPVRQVTLDQLTSGQPLTVVVTPEEDRALLKAFLEQAYFEWSDQPHQALRGQTPRHAAASEPASDRVEILIAEMERNDLGLARTGKQAFDYNRLRAHVGLEGRS